MEKSQYCLPVTSYHELYTPIFLSGVQKERTKEKILTDNMGLDVLCPRELNSLEHFIIDF